MDASGPVEFEGNERDMNHNRRQWQRRKRHSSTDLICVFDGFGRVLGGDEVLRQNRPVFWINVDGEIVEFDDESVFHPINDKLGGHDHHDVGRDLEQVHQVPLMLAQVADKDDIEQPEQVKTLSDIGTRDLKKVVFLESLEDRAFDFNEIV